MSESSVVFFCLFEELDSCIEAHVAVVGLELIILLYLVNNRFKLSFNQGTISDRKKNKGMKGKRSNRKKEASRRRKDIAKGWNITDRKVCRQLPV